MVDFRWSMAQSRPRYGEIYTLDNLRMGTAARAHAGVGQFRKLCGVGSSWFPCTSAAENCMISTVGYSKAPGRSSFVSGVFISSSTPHRCAALTLEKHSRRRRRAAKVAAGARFLYEVMVPIGTDRLATPSVLARARRDSRRPNVCIGNISKMSSRAEPSRCLGSGGVKGVCMRLRDRRTAPGTHAAAAVGAIFLLQRQQTVACAER